MAKKGQRIQRVAGLLGMAGGALGLAFVLSVSAQAQRGGGLFDNWFQPYPSERPAVVADYSRAPAAKKYETPPTSTVVVLGDSMADWLAYGLEDALSDTPEIGVVRKHRTASGLIRYDARNENQDWAQAARDIVAADKPNFIVMMVGLNDRGSIRERTAAAPARGATPPAATPPAAATPAAPVTPPAPATPNPEESEPAGTPTPTIAAPEPPTRGRAAVTVHEFRSDRWVELYTKRIDDTIAALKGRGVPVYWVGLPSIRGPKATSDVIFLNDLFRTRAEKAGIAYIDVWDGFVDEGGRFTLQGPDFEGQTRRLRAGDGVHFTKAGARKLAHYVDREIRRALTRGPVAVALPTTEPSPTPAPVSRPGGAIARPLVGPVVPLTSAATNANEELLGGTNARGPVSHVTATRVLVKGEAVPAPAGRGDDFVWPRRGVANFGTDTVVTTTTLPLPVMQQPPAATTVLTPTAETPSTPVVARKPAPRPQPNPWGQPWGGGGRNNSFPSLFGWR